MPPYTTIRTYTPKFSADERADILWYLQDNYPDRKPDSIQISTDGAVSAMMHPMPGSLFSGRVFVGYARDILNELLAAKS